MAETTYTEITPEEGHPCLDPECDGVFGFDKVQGCTCFKSPPCNACVDNPLVCLTCGREADEADG